MATRKRSTKATAFSPLSSGVKIALGNIVQHADALAVSAFWEKEVRSRNGKIISFAEIPLVMQHTHSQFGGSKETCSACRLEDRTDAGNALTQLQVTVERDRKLGPSHDLSKRSINRGLYKLWGHRQKIVIALARWEVKVLALDTQAFTK